MGKRLGIVGSRHFPAREPIELLIRSLPEDTVIVSGDAMGVDSWAIELGNARRLKTNAFHADWGRFGRKAGPIRNAEIVKNCNELAAFWDGRSRGTLNTIVQAASAGLPVQVFDGTGKLLDLKWVLEQARQSGVVAGIEKAVQEAGRSDKSIQFLPS